jgi:RNA polymerase sigma factor (sigma-70 family)
MKDYRLEIKIKNNYLYEKMQEYGISTASELARVVGLGPSVIGDILNLKVTPYTNKGTVRSSIQCLCDFFSCNPEDLFPAQHIFDPLTVNQGAIQANIGELMSSNLLESAHNPDLLVEITEQKEAIEKTLDQLTLREKKVLELRFGLGEEAECTLKEVVIKLGVKAELIRQIEAKALRKLRHPTRTRHIRLALEGEEFSEAVRNRRAAAATEGVTLSPPELRTYDERPYVERNRDTRLEYKAWQERVKKYGLDEALRQTATRQRRKALGE